MDTLQRLLHETGHQLVAVPGFGPDAFETGDRIKVAHRVILNSVDPSSTSSLAWAHNIHTVAAADQLFEEFYPPGDALTERTVMLLLGIFTRGLPAQPTALPRSAFSCSKPHRVATKGQHFIGIWRCLTPSHGS